MLACELVRCVSCGGAGVQSGLGWFGVWFCGLLSSGPSGNRHVFVRSKTDPREGNRQVFVRSNRLGRLR